MKKKILFIILLLIMPFYVNAATFKTSISCKKTSVNPGDEVSCTYTVNHDVDIVGIGAHYDLGGLKYESISSSLSYLGSPTSSGFGYYSSSKLQNPLTVATIKLQVPSSASAGQSFKFRIKDASVTLADEDATDMSIPDASVTLSIASDDNTLKALKVGSYSLIPEFSSSVTSYTVNNVKEAKISISATPNDSTASVSGAGEKTLKYGENLYSITVTSAKGTKKVYTIKINRPDNREEINTLSSLSVSDYTITPSFSSNVTTYNLNVNSDVTEVTINANKTSDKSSFVTNYGPRKVSLKYGTNEVKVEVKSENEKVKVYTIKINKVDNRDSNNNLSSLTLDNGKISFNKNTTSYTVNVENEIKTIEIKATAESGKAKIKGTGSKKLKEGSNKFEIVVTAENEKTKKYIINVNRAASEVKKETEVKKKEETPKEKEIIEEKETLFIKNLNIQNSTITFNPEIMNYEIETSDDHLEINYELYDGVEAIVENNENLINGSVVYLKLTNKNGETVTYIFNIKKEEEESPFEIDDFKEDVAPLLVDDGKSNTLLYIGLGAFGFIIIGIIIGLISGKKKKNEIPNIKDDVN